MELTEHLFRRESGRMVAVLTRIFGVHNLPLVEDVVQDAFCRALEVWPFRGVPENPSAWLMAAAKNRAVQRALYLLFNEGYHGASAESAVRTELCQEAMRLMALLLEHPLGATPTSYALSALMCFNKARLPARLDASGRLKSLFHQDRSTWDQDLVGEGFKLLELSARDSELTEHHLEAAIATVHAKASSVRDTDWGKIVSLYDTLLLIRPSPIVALNRAIAIGQGDGAERGLQELRAIAGAERLLNYPFYHAAFGESELQSSRGAVAREHFSKALGLSRNAMERRFFELRLNACGN